MEAMVSGIEVKTVNAESTSKASAAAVKKLRVQSDAMHKETCFNMAASHDDTVKLRGELRESAAKANEATANLLATILARMDRQERSFEARMDRQDQHAGYTQHDAQRGRYQGHGHQQPFGDAYQSGGQGNQQGNGWTPTGWRWDERDGNYEDEGTPIDGRKANMDYDN